MSELPDSVANGFSAQGIAMVPMTPHFVLAREATTRCLTREKYPAIAGWESRHSEFSQLVQPDGHDTAGSPISTTLEVLTVPRVVPFNTVILQKFLNF
jgi:hypothetical protein